MISIPVPSKSDTLRVASAALLTAADGHDQRVEAGERLPGSFSAAGDSRIMSAAAVSTGRT